MNLTRNVCRGAVIVAAVALSLPSDAAPDPNAIIHKADAAIKAAISSSKTYQAAIELTRVQGEQGSMTLGIEFKVIPAQGKAFVKVSPVGKATGQMAAAGAMMSMTIVDDGKTAYLYSAMQGGYSKQPHRKIDVPDFFHLAALKDVTLKYLRSDRVNGRTVHVIQATPSKAPPGASQTILFFIDQTSSMPVQLKTITSGPPRPGAPPMTVEMTIAVKKETVNASIAESTFKFTPPPGAKEIQGGGAGMNPLGRMFGGGGKPSK